MDAVGLTIVHDEVEAELLCGLLRTEGIACSHRHTDNSAGGWYGAPGMGGPTEILVDPADVERARAVLAAKTP